MVASITLRLQDMGMDGLAKTRSQQQSTRSSNIVDTPLQPGLIAATHLHFNTPSEAQQVEMAHHLPYRQQTRALPTTDVRSSYPSKLSRTDHPRQEPFCTPQGKLALLDDELFVKVLNTKLWTLAQELEAIGEAERVCLAGFEAATPEADVESRYWDTLSHARSGNTDSGRNHVPSIWRMNEQQRA